MLAKHLSCWTKSLDEQLSMRTDEASDVHHFAEVDPLLPRELKAHPTGETIAPSEDDLESCATTEPWDVRTSRKPRCRPNRRAKRHARLLDFESLVRQQSISGASELAWDTGKIPISAFGALAACLEESDAEVHEGTGAWSSPQVSEAREERDDTQVTVDELDVTLACSSQDRPMASNTGLKRKLDAVEFDVLDPDDFTSFAAVPFQACEGEQCERNLLNEQESAHTLDAYYLPMRTALCEIYGILDGTPPLTAKNIEFLCDSIRAGCDKLKRLLKVRPRYGLIVASRAVELIQTEITERPGAGGLHAWCNELDVLLSEFDCLERQDQQFYLSDVQEEMVLHASTIEYCLQAFDELLEEERSNDAEDRSIVEGMLQQRLTASLAARR